MRLRRFRKKDIRAVAKIKNSVFKKFNKSEYFKKEAIKEYLSQTDLKKSDEELLESFKVNQRDLIFYIVEESKKLIGYIQGKKNKISNLFVLGESHRKGVGTNLLNLFEKEARKQKSKEIRIRSSIYAIPFYERQGYKKTTGIRNFRGLKFQPMKKIL